LRKYSHIETLAITLASAEVGFEEYCSPVVSYLFTEDLEIMSLCLSSELEGISLRLHPPSDMTTAIAMFGRSGGSLFDA